MKIVVPLLTLIIGLTIGYHLKATSKNQPNISPQNQMTLQGISSITGKTYRLQDIIEQTSDVRIIAPTKQHLPILNHIQSTGLTVSQQMSQTNSPARTKKRINEVSAVFEDALRQKLHQHPDFTCSIPKNKFGKIQRSGYPDLRLEHLPSKTVVYLDPKLFEETSIDSTFRSFYFEPNLKKSKITEDALHLILGFPHNGKTHQWTFSPPKLIDLSDLQVTLKTEFSASNRQLYSIEPERSNNESNSTTPLQINTP